MEKGVLVDLTRCIGCRGCQVACKEWNQMKAEKTKFRGDYTNPVKLDANCYTRIAFTEGERDGKTVWSFVKNQCMHCKDPACVSVCPVGSLQKTAAGPVTYDFDKCIGCRYCMMACPFHIPKYEWESNDPWVQKCSFCAERIADGMEPACTKVCPTGTLHYDDYDKVVAEAKRRLKESPGKYVDHIYGMKEAGGTNWIYISGVPFEELGFNMNVPKIALPSLTWEYISHIPALFGVVFAAGIGSWLITRRNENKEEQS